MAFYNKDISEILNELNSSENGLSNSQVETNRTLFGSNEPEKQVKIGFLKRFLSQFKNIMIIILLISAIISSVTALLENELENLFEGLLIFVIVIINAIVGVVQEQKAENALLALKNRIKPFSKIIRNGKLNSLQTSEIVVGDIIHLKAGDYIPADIRIISSTNFKCDESSLTGESHDIEKSPKTIKTKNNSLSAQTNICFSGTTVKSGKATGIVVAVGPNTEFGKIAKILNTSKKEKTPLEKNIDKIGKFITIFVLCIVAIVFLIQVLLNKNISLMQALLTSVALAVAAIPESLPAVITIILALGVQKLAKQNAIVKKLSAVETLGCCNIVCTDKTGTLTENKMSVRHISIGTQIFQENEVDLNHQKILRDICCVCNNVSFSGTEMIGDATEKAIVSFLKLKNIDFETIKSDYKRISENEFNSTRKTMSILVENSSSKSLMVKGAIDYILPKCSSVLIGDKIQFLSDSLKQKILSNNEQVCEKGERIIAFATKNNPESQEESNLVFIGFIGIIDPPRKEVFNAIKLNKKAGIKTIMITGDHPTTAFAIAKTLGISKSKTEVLTGKDIDNLSEKEFSRLIDNYSVFARVSPEHKLKIVKALKIKNIVSMTGDGVNDAPSVKNANIGICMGITGTDVTKEVADIIISDDNYLTIASAIKQGRTIYQNIEKTILFLLSTNIVEVLGIFITSILMHNNVFLLPTQILFINLVTDSLPAFALGIEESTNDIMNQPPRDSNKSILSGITGSSIIYQGFIQTLVVLVMFVFATHKYSGEIASTMSFLTICLMQIIHAINCKSHKSIFKMNIFKNKFFNFSFIFLLGLVLTIYFVPPLATLFSLTKLNLTQWLIVSITSIMIIPAVELGKIFIKG